MLCRFGLPVGRSLSVRRGLAAAFVLSMAICCAGALYSPLAASAAPTPPFAECPAIGDDTSCGVLIVVNANGSTSNYVDSSQGQFDGQDDVLVGVLNNSSSTLTTLPLTGNAIFAFDGDGICSGDYTGTPSGCPFGPTGYEGPNTSFSITDQNTGSVDFPKGLAPGASTYFSLEGTAGSVAPPPPGVDLGVLDLNRYCTSIGYVKAALSKPQRGPGYAYNNWVCVAASGATALIDLQRACEATYSPRPILAHPTDADDAYSWHCYQLPPPCLPVDDRAAGHRISAVGDWLHASNVVVVVPGVANNYGTFPQILGYAQNIEAEVGRLRPLPPATAVIAWLGYNPPDGFTLPEAATSGDAKVGAANLANFVGCLRTNSDVPNFRLTVIGHSYGSTVVGNAAKMGALNGDNVVFVGSPGVDASSVHALGHPSGVYAGANPNDPVVGLFTSQILRDITDAGIVGGPVCSAMKAALSSYGSLITNVLCGSGTAFLGHGPDPTSPQFGARHFSTEGECGHGYFGDNGGHGTEGLMNLALIGVGRGAQVTRERRAPIAPVTLHFAKLVNFIPQLSYVSWNWPIGCPGRQADSGTGALAAANATAADYLFVLAGPQGIVLHSVINLAVTVKRARADYRYHAALGKNRAVLRSRTFNVHLTAPGRESVSIIVFATRHARTHKTVLIAHGKAHARRKGVLVIRIHITAAGAKLLRALGITKTNAAVKLRNVTVGVLVRRRGRTGYFVGPLS